MSRMHHACLCQGWLQRQGDPLRLIESGLSRCRTLHRCCLWGFTGRVPAHFCGCVGIKPTVGRVSSTGVVRACRALDCISIFARTVSDAALVLRLMQVRVIPPVALYGLQCCPASKLPNPHALFALARSCQPHTTKLRSASLVCCYP